MHYIRNVELKFQPQYVFNACFGFRAKFQNNMVSEISTFCNHKNLNNICNNFVNTDYEEVSAYNCVLSMDHNPISTALGQQTDHIQSHVENSTPKSAPSLLFEASGRFFGVVYHDVSQETFCDSSTFCPSVGSIEGATNNVAISKNSTSKNEGSKNGSIQNGASKAHMAKMPRNQASKSLSYTTYVSMDKSTMTIHILLLLLLLLLEILTIRGIVLKNQNTFLKIKNVLQGVRWYPQITTILTFGPHLDPSMKYQIMFH